MSFYPPKIQKRFENPQNAGGAECADAIGSSGSFTCGAVLRISLKIENGKIVEAKFKAAGCGFLFAAADILCEKLCGKFIGQFDHARARGREEAKKLIGDLNEFYAEKSHCFEVVLDALAAAVNDFRALETESWNDDEALICTCFGVSEKTIETVIAENLLTTVEDVTHVCNAGGGCGSCQPLIEEILEDVWRG